MLCQFSVQNFRCLRDRAVLSMIPYAPVRAYEDSLLQGEDGHTFLPLAAVYGPNGGGKSTVMDALYSLCFKVMNPVVTAMDGVKNGIANSFSHEIVPFRFDEASAAEPVEYEIHFRENGYEYEYSLSILKQNIQSESLYRKKILHGKYTRVFSRSADEGIYTIAPLRGSLGKEGGSSIRSDLPLLSYLAIVSGRNDIISNVMHWFGTAQFLDYKDPTRENIMNIPDKGPGKQLILDLFDEMGLDIKDYRIEYVTQGEDDTKQIKIFTTHIVNGKRFELDLHRESSGTAKIFNSLPYIVHALHTGGVLVADELDAKLHPVLLGYIIRLFSDPSKNKQGAQLIFTSQDLTTMTAKYFRRDEIWFVCKNDGEEAQLYSLADFKEERNSRNTHESYAENYLKGRYGADPFLRKIIDWNDLAADRRIS